MPAKLCGPWFVVLFRGLHGETYRWAFETYRDACQWVKYHFDGPFTNVKSAEIVLGADE